MFFSSNVALSTLRTRIKTTRAYVCCPVSTDHGIMARSARICLAPTSRTPVAHAPPRVSPCRPHAPACTPCPVISVVVATVSCPTISVVPYQSVSCSCTTAIVLCSCHLPFPLRSRPASHSMQPKFLKENSQPLVSVHTRVI
jgi:hypothetical protein